MLFDVAMTVFFRIKFRRIGWYFFHHDLGMGRQKRACEPTAMWSSPIPDQNQRPGHVPVSMLQRVNDLHAFDGPCEMAFDNLA